jgi:hypothetical protein
MKQPSNIPEKEWRSREGFLLHRAEQMVKAAQPAWWLDAMREGCIKNEPGDYHAASSLQRLVVRIRYFCRP